MKLSVIDRPPATIAFFRHIGPYGKPIARFWRTVYLPWAVMNNLGADHARFGISHDDPANTDSRNCRYDACAEVAADFVANGGAQLTTIPGGRYAVIQFRGTAEQLKESWAALLCGLPSIGLKRDSRPSFEYFPKGSRYDFVTGEFECQICIPVVPVEKLEPQR